MAKRHSKAVGEVSKDSSRCLCCSTLLLHAIAPRATLRSKFTSQCTNIVYVEGST